MIKIWGTEIKHFTFPGGEEHVNVLLAASPKNCAPQAVSIYADLRSSEDCMTLFMVLDAVKRLRPLPIILTMPYLPYARQDRVCNTGEALGLKVFCDILNSFECDRVIVHDVHSDVSSALINNVDNMTQVQLYVEADDRVLEYLNTYTIVAPDSSAYKKINNTYLDSLPVTVKDLVFASKVRDLKTGAITHTELHGDVEGKNCIMVDDICDGGRTFIELAKVLREKGARKIVLFVTHGIFSKGKDVLYQHIDEIYAVHDWTVTGE